MSENMIHFWDGEASLTPCKIEILATAYALGTPDWREVTCEACRLEEPLRPAGEAPEYRVPESVKRSDQFEGAQTFLADTLPRAALLHRRLAKAKALEEMALGCMSHWARTLAEVVKLREDTERALSELLPGGQAQVVAQVGTKKILAQNAAQRAGRSERVEHVHVGGRVIEETKRAVDIRTEPEYAEGMTNLSEAAKATLIDALGGTQAARNGSSRELFEAGLIGPNNGLTRKGAIARAKLVQAAEDAAFG